MFNNILRKITPAGIVTTVAGSAGRFGFAEGTGSNAVFGFLSQLTLDAAGNIYTTDAANHIIWKITAAGAATRFSGAPTSSGSTDGATTTARFYSPAGIVGAPNGAFYVADLYNNTIRVVSGEGNVTTLAGKAGLPSYADGTGGAARFHAPYGTTLDSSGNLYVTDFGNSTVRKITPQGTVTSLAPPGDNLNMQGIARLANGDVYVTSLGPDRVVRISASATTTTFAGPDSIFPDPGNGYIPKFILPRGIIADREENLYVADEFNSVIRKITPAGVISNWAGNITRSGSSDGSLADAHFGYPRGLAIDLTGNIYVADTRNSTIRKITAAGQVSTLAGLAGFYGFEDGVGAAARFNQPDALAVDQNGNIFVADTGNRTIRRITPEGVVTTVGGFPGLTGNANGPSAVARFSKPTGIAIDNNGSLYIVDQDNNSIRKGTLIVGGSPPTIATQPRSQTAFAGSVVVFSVTSSSGSSSTFQWYFNGRPILGATGSSYALFSATSSDAGNYTAFVSNGQGITMSTPAVLTVDLNPNPNPQASQITNISTRSFVGQGASAQIAGFVIGGTEPKPVFIRANGPALTQFGLTGVLSDPKLTLNSSTSVIAENDDWNSVPADRDQILSIINQRNLFSFAPGSKDAALVVTLAPGNYTAIVSGSNGTTGVALIEVYDLASAANQSRLVNISTRTEVHSGAEVAIGGFVISGSAPKTVLIRAGGPALAQFNVPGLLADPTLTIYSGQNVISQNDDWETPESSSVLAANQKAGAFPFASGSKDAALVLVLQPGAYTAIVSGKNSANGVALLEVYEVQ